MKRMLPLCLAILATVAVIMVPAGADDDGGSFRIRLSGFQEVPAVSTPATGTFTAKQGGNNTKVDYTLSYQGLQADATQAHLHFGQKSVNGGISVWLCSNLASPPTPPGVQACPLRSGTVSGTITATNVVGPAGQGIAPGEFAELLRALNNDVVYANVHSTMFPGGEIRGQVESQDDDD